MAIEDYLWIIIINLIGFKKNKNKPSIVIYSYSPLGKCHFMADPHIQTGRKEKQ